MNSVLLKINGKNTSIISISPPGTAKLERGVNRLFNAQAQFSNEVNIQAINKVVSQANIESVVEKAGTRELRLNKLSAALTIWFCIALNLYITNAYKDVLSKLAKGLRYIWPNHNLKLPGKSALCQARYRLGVAPMVELFRQTGKPIADLSVPGAYLFGLRLMAIDGTTEDVADSSENVPQSGVGIPEHAETVPSRKRKSFT